MSPKDLKKELVAYIENTDNVELLSLLKEDLVFYGKVKDADIADTLTGEQIKELQELYNEDQDKDIDTLKAFKKATEQWRTK
ncbi:MAG: hypothetical protein ABJB11_24435 [Ferruginibacter sp.]